MDSLIPNNSKLETKGYFPPYLAPPQHIYNTAAS